MSLVINKTLEFGLRTITKDLKTGFYKGRNRAWASTVVEDQPTRPFVDALVTYKYCDIDMNHQFVA